MKTNRFYITEEITDSPEITITNHTVIHQMKNVLRLQKGDPVILLNGVGQEYHGRVKIFLKKFSIFEGKLVNPVDKLKIEKPIVKLAPAILKKDKMEWVLQKCTEIGVSEFLPCVSHRTEKQNLNFERMQKIIIEAFEQSEKIFLPELSETKSIQDICEENLNIKKVYLDFCDQKIDLNKIKKEKEILIFVGPEGGFSDEDKKVFDKYKVMPVSLGATVLRAETASMSVASLILLG